MSFTEKQLLRSPRGEPDHPPHAGLSDRVGHGRPQQEEQPGDRGEGAEEAAFPLGEPRPDEAPYFQVDQRQARRSAPAVGRARRGA